MDPLPSLLDGEFNSPARRGQPHLPRRPMSFFGNTPYSSSFESSLDSFIDLSSLIRSRPPPQPLHPPLHSHLHHYHSHHPQGDAVPRPSPSPLAHPQHPGPGASPLGHPQHPVPGISSTHGVAHGWPALISNPNQLSQQLLGLAGNSASTAFSANSGSQYTATRTSAPYGTPAWRSLPDWGSANLSARETVSPASLPIPPVSQPFHGPVLTLPQRAHSASFGEMSASAGGVSVSSFSDARLESRPLGQPRGHQAGLEPPAEGGLAASSVTDARLDSRAVVPVHEVAHGVGERDPLPQGQGLPGGQEAHVVDLRDDVGHEGEAAGPQQPREGGGGNTSLQRYDLSQAARWMEQGVPFCMLLGIVFIREHIAGFVAFIWLTVILVRSNDLIRKQAALKGDRSVCQLLAMVVLLLGHVAAIMWLFNGKELLLTLALWAPKQSPQFLEAVFTVFINDNLIRYVGMTVKCLLLCSFSRRRSSRHQAQMLTLVEYSILLHRAIAPSPVWYRYFLNDRLGHLFSALITGLYLTFKLTSILDRLILFLTSLRQVIRREAQYGNHSTQEEVLKAGEMCSICHDKMITPITLRCLHVFCEDCVSEWFEREQTCPLCRTVVRNPSLKSFGDASTTLTMQVF